MKERSRSAISLRFAHHDHQLLIFTTRITNDIQPHCLPYNGPPVAAAMPPKPQPVASRPRKQQETRSPRELELIAALARRQYIRQITGRTPKQDFEPDKDELDDADSASDSDDLGAYLGESDDSDDGGLDADSDFEAKEDDGSNTIQLQAELLERLERGGSEGPGDAGFEEKSFESRDWALNETIGMCNRMVSRR